ncbi:MAG: hypothetical protein RIH33_11390, partial [Marinoscillum sp.]
MNVTAFDKGGRPDSAGPTFGRRSDLILFNQVLFCGDDLKNKDTPPTPLKRGVRCLLNKKAATN